MVVRGVGESGGHDGAGAGDDDGGEDGHEPGAGHGWEFVGVECNPVTN